MVERLTTTSDKGGLAFTFGLDVTCKPSEMAKILALGERLAAYENTGLTPEEIAEIKKREAIFYDVSKRWTDLGDYYHIRDLMDAERDGRLVTLPDGKIGDIVEWDSGVCKELFLIRGIVIYCDGTRYDLGEFMPVADDEHICRIIPRAEAEAALKGEAEC